MSIIEELSEAAMTGALGRLFGVTLLLSSLVDPTLADSSGDSLTVDGVLIYLGLLPAEMMRGHPAGYPETSMHGGRPSGREEYHVVIALFDAKSGRASARGT